MSTTKNVGERRVVANVLRGSIGNLVEWYDWYVYAAFSVYFAKAFFPEGDPTAQLLSTAAVFAVGFLMRPLGGWALGRYADRFGRRSALTLSVTVMAAGSLVIAVTPSYATIGVVAPVAAAARPVAAGAVGRWRVRHQRDLPFRGRVPRPARVLLQLPVRHAWSRAS